MVTFSGLAGTVLVIFFIDGAIHKVTSLLLPSSEDRPRQRLFTSTILAAVAVTTPWATYVSIAGCLLKNLCWMLLFCLLFMVILAAVASFVPSAMEGRYNGFTFMFTYAVAMILSKVLRMPSNSFLDKLLLVFYCLMLLGYMCALAEKLVPSAMEERYPGFTHVVGFVLMLLGTRVLWIIMSWSTPIQKPAMALLELPSASTAFTDITFTSIQKMKVEHERDTEKMLAALAWMIKNPISVVALMFQYILITVIAMMNKFLKKKIDELINTCISKVTAFLED